MEGAFDKYPNVEIVADAMDPIYRVKFMECVKDGAVMRFEKMEFRVPRKRLESLLAEVIEVSRNYGR